MREIPLGATGTCTLRVKPEHLAPIQGRHDAARLLATPVMILIMENARA